MTLSPNVRRLLAVLTGLVLVVMYAPLLIVVINSFNESQSLTWPPSGLTLDWWQRAAHSDGARSAVVDQRPGRSGGHGHRARARHADGAGAAALSVLRQELGEPAGHPADRPAGHRHRHRAQQRVPGHPRAAADDPDGDHRARHILHRHGVQQRPGSAATRRRQPRGGVGRPGRWGVDDVPARHLPAAALGPAGRRPAGVRPELRRDHRDDVHRRRRRRRRCRSGS